MGWFEVFKRKEEPVMQFVRVLEVSGASALLQLKAEELIGRTHSGTTGQWLAWQELSWAREHSTDRAKRLRVEACASGINIGVSQTGNSFSNLDTLYHGAKPFKDLTLKEKIEMGTRFAEPISQTPASNSSSTKV